MKVMTVVGTRPELIRLSCVIRRLDNTPGISHILVHTGQNYDYELNQIFFDDLGIRPPDYMLGVDTSSLGTVLGGTLVAVEDVIIRERPEALLVLGDTNSSIAALMARRMQVPVYHMEAGNRCFDLNVPEETNRRLVDHVSDFNLVYTEHARRNLLAEGLHPQRILKTGSPMTEILQFHRTSIESSTALSDHQLESGRFILVSAHRQENVDSTERLRMLLDTLAAVKKAFGLPIYISTHPRTRARLAGLPDWRPPSDMIFSRPLGFFDYNKLQLEAFCSISDSGTIAEESSILGFPAVTLRNSIERPEALDTGSIIMTGLIPDLLVDAVASTTKSRSVHAAEIPDDYRISNTSERVVNFIMSTIYQHAVWAGIRQ